MKGKVIIGLSLALASSPAYAEDPCFDGMCKISLNGTTGVTTITRLSDAEIAILRTPNPEPHYPVETEPAKPVTNPTPIYTETATAVSTTSTTQVNFNEKSPTVTITETATVKVETSTAVIEKPKSILDEELDLTWNWDKIIAWIVAWFDKIWIKL